jgi:hypothetical protein
MQSRGAGKRGVQGASRVTTTVTRVAPSGGRGGVSRQMTRPPQQVVTRTVVNSRAKGRRVYSGGRNSLVPTYQTLVSTKVLAGAAAPVTTQIYKLGHFGHANTQHTVLTRLATNNTGDYYQVYPTTMADHGMRFRGVEVVHRGSTSRVGAIYSVTLIDMDNNSTVHAATHMTDAVASQIRMMTANSATRLGPFDFNGGNRHWFALDVSNDTLRELANLAVVVETFGIGMASGMDEETVIRLWYEPPSNII